MRFIASPNRRTSEKRYKGISVSHPRRASTLMIVMVLMGMLSLLGVIFYLFSAQERSNAEYYSEASKERGDPSLDADTLFDWALEQIIVGTDPRLKNSMLWGSRHSLLSNMLGVGYHRPSTDRSPFTGEGVNLIFDGSNNIVIDQDRDGTADGNLPNFINYVDAPAAQGLYERSLLTNEDTNGNWRLDPGEDTNNNGVLDRFPQSDVGYTYPDINNVFLCYVSKVRDQNGNIHRVVKPSYLVPGILRTVGGAPNTNWFADPTTAGRVMRGHPNHLYAPATTSSSSPAKRYLTNAEAVSLIGPTARGFPFAPMDTTYDTTGGGAGAVYSLGRMGAYSNVDPLGNLANEPVEFDYDNDGDGIRESILIDLDFPPQQDASGKLFVPLFLVTIHDLDALLNLNVHGNLARVEYDPSDVGQATTPVSNVLAPFGTDSVSSQFYYVSQSNLALGPAEVNPLWALNRRVGIDDAPLPANQFNFFQHSQFFGRNPILLGGVNPPWGETANMEFLWSKIGKPHYGSTGIDDLYAGTYGEAAILYQAIVNSTYHNAGGTSLPRAGISLQDDNVDVNEGQSIFPYFQHPLDFTGMGSFTSSGSPKQVNFASSGSNRWISYSKYANNSTSTAGSNILWGKAAGLMNNSLTQGLKDDPYEFAPYATDRRDIDSPLPSEEMAYLQLNNTEINRLNVTSRLANLLPFNFDKTPGTNSRSESIRRKFTTESNDRKSFSFPFSKRSLGNLGTGQEYSFDAATNTFKFPPQFGPITRYNTTPLAEDPIRLAVRFLLEIELNSTQQINRPQRKLSVNSLLTGSTTNNMAFRNLTPHPDDPGATSVSSKYTATNPAIYPPSTTDYLAQEFWARRDRQQLARDIYVLLYLLGHGDDNVNTATTTNAAYSVYTAAQLAEMAQFAVNLVDAMDHDSVITRFEYDTDLSNGWNVDDDPFSSVGEADRAEAFGVERLDLSISEGLVFKTDKITSGAMKDHPATSYDDSKPHYFGFVELYNQSPFDITFNSSEAWQLVVEEANGTWERALSLKTGTIASGKRYMIGSADADIGSSAPGKSIFRVDPNWVSGTPDFTQQTVWMAPYQLPINNPPTNDGLDLMDVSNPSTTYRVMKEDGSDVTGTQSAPGWMAVFSSETYDSSNLRFTLRRRLNPNRTYIQAGKRKPGSATMPTYTDDDNPYVDVDVMTLNTPSSATFTLGAATDVASVIQTQLKKLKSYERPQPLDQASTAQHGASTVQVNSFSAANSNAAAAYTPFVWQPHFDRDFTSIVDLLNIPLFGPHGLTSNMKNAIRQSPENQTTALTAAAKFLVPYNANTGINNRWHRVLEFLEVPTRTNRNLGLGSDLSIQRVPGKININMLRHAENFAALIDDSRFVGLDLLSAPTDPEAPWMPDQQGDASRDWWRQFVISRDKVDPYWAAAVPLPGLPGSKPFRSLADVGYVGTNPSIEDTILRSLPIDSGSNKRRLLEVGQSSEHQVPSDEVDANMNNVLDPAEDTNGNGIRDKKDDDIIDPVIRHRLLAKVANNSTTRSNCFGIFISVKYFQAVADPAANGAIRIGGPLNGKPDPEHRGFFVVDRSKLEQGKSTGATNYDFRAFVNYRKTLQTQ